MERNLANLVPGAKGRGNRFSGVRHRDFGIENSDKESDFDFSKNQSYRPLADFINLIVHLKRRPL